MYNIVFKIYQITAEKANIEPMPENGFSALGGHASAHIDDRKRSSFATAYYEYQWD